MKEIKITVKDKFVSRYKKKNPLILRETIVMPKNIEDGTIISLYSSNNHFLGKGYWGVQNKGIGWILTFSSKEIIDEKFIVNKLTKGIMYRKDMFNHEETNAYRLFNGEGDGVGGVTIDYYDGYYLINWYNYGIYTFRNIVYDLLKRQSNYKGIYEKKRLNQAGKYIEGDDFVYGIQPDFPLIVKQDNMKYAVYLNEGAMVGVFLDQREVRKRIKEVYAKGKSVLNTFSYTGAFSIGAALGGAKKTTSVDLANRSRSKTIEHFEINNIEVGKQDIIVEDVFNYFKYAVRKELEFDLVILDPPSFAKSKKHIFSASKNYVDLLINTIKITADNGVIIASTNCSTFDMRKFESFVKRAFEEVGDSYKILNAYQLPADFKTIPEFAEGNYLKVLIIQKKN